MNKPIIERDVVLIGKTEEGNDTFDLPVTRLANIENDAEVKEKPDTNDFFPVIDMSDNGKMKKTPSGGILVPLTEHIADSTKHVTPEEKSRWNEKANGNHHHDNRYYTESETDSRLSGKADKDHTHPAVTASAPGFMTPEDKKKLDGLSGFTLKSVQEFALGSTPVYPTFTVPEGAEYYFLIFKLTIPTRTDCLYLFSGLHHVGGTTDINTGRFDYALFIAEGGSMGSDAEYVRVSGTEQIKVSAYTGEAFDAKICNATVGSTVIQAVFF